MLLLRVTHHVVLDVGRHVGGEGNAPDARRLQDDDVKTVELLLRCRVLVGKIVYNAVLMLCDQRTSLYTGDIKHPSLCACQIDVTSSTDVTRFTHGHVIHTRCTIYRRHVIYRRYVA